MNEDRRDNLIREAMRQQELLQGYAYGILGDWALAQDAFQEALIAVNHSWETLDPDRGLAGWMRRVVHNKSVDILRARNRQGDVNSELVDRIAGHFDQFLNDDSAVDQLKLRKKAMHRCMPKLRRETQAIFQGFYYKRLSCSELARMHERTVNAIRLTLSKARKTVRKCVDREIDAMEGA